jgi:choline dehydrogenase-like flavoprotein
MKDPWEFTHGNKIPKREANPIVSKCYAYDAGTEHFFVKDENHPYVQEKPFDWIRGYQVGGKSLIWARQTQRWSPHEFDAHDGLRLRSSFIGRRVEAACVFNLNVRV